MTYFESARSIRAFMTWEARKPITRRGSIAAGSPVFAEVTAAPDATAKAIAAVTGELRGVFKLP